MQVRLKVVAVDDEHFFNLPSNQLFYVNAIPALPILDQSVIVVARRQTRPMIVPVAKVNPCGSNYVFQEPDIIGFNILELPTRLLKASRLLPDDELSLNIPCLDTLGDFNDLIVAEYLRQRLTIPPAESGIISTATKLRFARIP